MRKTTQEMKRSTLPWLDCIPSDWEERSLGLETWVRARLGWKGLTASEYVDNGIPMLATPDIKGASINFDSAVRITGERYDESPEIMLAVGDVLLTKDGSTIGTVNLVRELPEPATVNGSIAVITPNDGLDGSFLYWVIASNYAQSLFSLLRDGMGVPHLFQRDINRIRIPFPPLATQRRIAEYLDCETGEIDTMIAKMDELARQLEERKSDVIQRSTTSLKDRMSRMKFFANVSLGKTVQGAQKYEHEMFVNYVRAASIQRHGLELDDQRMWMSDLELQKYDLRRNDVLVVEGGAGYGRSVVLDADMPGWGFQNHVIRLRPNSGVDGRFLDYCIKGHLRGGLIDILVDGATIPALSSEKARELPVPNVTPDEQKRLADYLDEATSHLDLMLVKVAELKTLLTERRAALITDVVTGRKEVA